MTPIVAFCYNYHFSCRPLVEAITDIIMKIDNDTEIENCWIGVNSGGKHHQITTEETNEFLIKYLIGGKK